MGRESSGDSGHSHSSIALLQERFRQLQRAKEMRAEREHLRGASVTEHRSGGGGGGHHPGEQREKPQWFLHPELVRPSRPLSAAPRARRVELDAPAFGAAGSMVGVWPERPAAGRSMSSSDAVDVDTSLHL